MILSALTGKALPIAGVIILAMAGAIYWLMQERDALNERVGTLEQANEQLATAAREQAAENAALNAELDRRDSIVTSAIRARQAADKAARNAQQQLREALANDECSQTAHPAALTDSLRSLTADHQDRDGVPVPADSADRADR